MPNQTLTQEQAAKLLGVSTKTIYRAIKRYGIKSRTQEGHPTVLFKEDLMLYASKITKNKKHRPKKQDLATQDAPQSISIVPDDSVYQKSKETIIIAVSKLIFENLGEVGYDKSTVDRYATAILLKQRYMQDGDFAAAKMFQLEIQHYEQQLLLTPKALAKIVKAVPEQIDEMERLLSS